MNMADNDVFLTELTTAINGKTTWYDTEELPRILTEYRNLQAHVANLFQALLKKGSISEDPYKHDKKISDIVVPEDTPYLENERAVIIGSRLSDFDSMLDFVCNYLKFSVESLTADRIKKLISLNSCFQWTALVPSSTRPNTRGLAEMLTSLRQGSDAISISVINDCLNHASKCINIINTGLKDLADFQKEVYKAEIRTSILANPEFLGKNAHLTAEVELAYIKRSFPAVMRKKPFYSELIDEIIQEDFSPGGEGKKQIILNKMVVKKALTKKKERQIIPKDSLMDAIRTLASIVPQLEQITIKIEDNKKVLESEHSTFFAKLTEIFRKAFNLQEPPVVYKIIIVDPLTQVKHAENLVYQDFAASIVKRARYYSSISISKNPGFQKLQAFSEDKILEFLVRQLNECQKLLVTLNALDEYFKATPMPLNRVKIKGLKMEITALKNTLVKTNQRKAEYAAYVEEQNQLKRLGIING